jgi:hypothetical protein
MYQMMELPNKYANPGFISKATSAEAVREFNCVVAGIESTV